MQINREGFLDGYTTLKAVAYNFETKEKNLHWPLVEMIEFKILLLDHILERWIVLVL